MSQQSLDHYHQKAMAATFSSPPKTCSEAAPRRHTKIRECIADMSDLSSHFHEVGEFCQLFIVSFKAGAQMPRQSPPERVAQDSAVGYMNLLA